MDHHRLNGIEFLDYLRGIISDNLGNNQFDVSELASQIGISRSSLHRRLKKITGVPAGVFIRRYKLAKARALLEESSANITEIAFECGFNSLTYFDICFKEHFGHSPGKIRKDPDRAMYSKKDIELSEPGKPPWDYSKTIGNQLHNFPVPVTSFIGREKELEIIAGLLMKYRVVSLVGPGGCGKTRLAFEVVARLEKKFVDGIWFVDLSPLENGEFVAKEVMNTLNIPESGDEEMIETLVRNAKDMNCLIVLDNCEHLSDYVARVADRLSQSTGGISILTTSRMILGTKGEKVWTVPPLSLVDPEKVTRPEQAEQSEAVLLFADRARLTDPRFKILSENCRDTAMICRQLDGIPLAVELVASRVRYMEPAMMLKRLSGNFSEVEAHDPGIIERHRTMNAAIDWSYNLLLEEEKLLFTRLSVFSGGFDLEAIEAVCSDESIPAEYMLDLVSSLIDRSMVNTIRTPGQPVRYYLLETLRQYATGLLLEKELNRLQKHHLKYFTSIAERAYKERWTAQVKWLGRLNLEFENMQAALNWAGDHNRTVYNLLAGLMAWFWTRSGHYYLARKILGDIIRNGSARSETKARVLAGYSWAISDDFSQFHRIISFLKQSVSIWHRLGKNNEEAIATAEVSMAVATSGDNEDGLNYAMKARELALVENDPGVMLVCLWPLSQILVNLKRCEEVKPVTKNLLELSEQLANLTTKLAGHHNSGDCAAMQGMFDIAEKEYGKGLEVTVRSGDMNYLFTELIGIAIAAAGMGRYEKALRLVGASNEAAKKAGSISREKLPMQFWQELIKEHIEGARQKLGEEHARKYEAEGAAMELEEAIAYALDFERD